MNLLENFVNKFTIEQSTPSISLNFTQYKQFNSNNDDSCNTKSGQLDDENYSVDGYTTNAKTYKSYIPTGPISPSSSNTTVINSIQKCFNMSNNSSLYNDNKSILNNQIFTAKDVNSTHLNANNNGNTNTSTCNSYNNNILAINSNHNHHNIHHQHQNQQSQDHNQKKGMRNMFNYSQIEILETIFEQTHYPDSTMREKLSAQLGINPSRIQVWFQNRRAKFRKFDPKNKRSNLKRKQNDFLNYEKLSGVGDGDGGDNLIRTELPASTFFTIQSSYPQIATIANVSIQSPSITSNPSLSSSSSTSSTSSSSTSTPYCSHLIINNNTYKNYLKNLSSTLLSTSCSPTSSSSSAITTTTATTAVATTTTNNTPQLMTLASPLLDSYGHSTITDELLNHNITYYNDNPSHNLYQNYHHHHHNHSHAHLTQDDYTVNNYNSTNNYSNYHTITAADELKKVFYPNNTAYQFYAPYQNENL